MPLCEGTKISATSPLVTVTRSASINAFTAKAPPLSRWHQRQWQPCTIMGVLLIS
jgi:hypothetical protein